MDHAESTDILCSDVSNDVRRNANTEHEALWVGTPVMDGIMGVCTLKRLRCPCVVRRIESNGCKPVRNLSRTRSLGWQF